MDTKSIKLSILIAAPISHVWDCLTQSKNVHHWWSSQVKLEPYLQGGLEELWENEQGQTVVTRGKVLAIQPPQELILSWADEDWSAETQVTFLLVSSDNNTLLTLAHKGWEHFPNQLGDTLLAHHQKGWTELLQNLKVLAETNNHKLQTEQN